MITPVRPLVVVADPIHEAGVALLAAQCEVVSPSPVTLRQAKGYIVRTSRLSAAQLDQCPHLKVIAKHGAGIDNIDMDAATDRGIVVANTPGDSNAIAVAEGAIALILAAMRFLPQQHQAVLGGEFNRRNEFRGLELSGKAIGIVGAGNVGTIMARICRKGFGMTVLLYDPYVDAEHVASLGAHRSESLHQLLSDADIVSIHVPLTAGTQLMIGAQELSLMKSSAILVNTARGGIVDESALYMALSSGKLRGAGLDVFEHEPPDPENPLFALPNVVLSPHTAGLTEESLRQMAIRAASVILDVLADRKPATILNPGVWDHRRQ